MKGLLKNNFYAVRSSAKVFSAFMFLLGVFVIVVVSQQLLLFYMLLGIIGFSMNAVASMGKEYISKWGKYKLTTPVKRADIVKSYFINQLIWLAVGIIFAVIGMGLSWLLHGCPFGQSIDALLMFSAGISISLFAGAIFFPLFYLGGEEKTGVFLVISLLCAIGITMAISTFINIALISEMTIWKIILKAAVMLACSLLALALSYPLTVAIFRRKEY